MLDHDQAARQRAVSLEATGKLPPGFVEQHQIDELADDIGRLRRRATNTEVDGWTFERVSNRLDTLDAIIYPTAAELANTAAPGDKDALIEAIRIVDARRASLQHRMRP